MHILVVYYSMDGNTKWIAEGLAKELGADLAELKLKKEFPREGFQKYFRAGGSAYFKACPKLKNPKIDTSRYEMMVLGMPIWAGNCASPINTFLKQNRLSGKKIACFACHAGGGAEKCFARLRRKLAGNKIVGEIDFCSPLTNEKMKAMEKAVAWARQLLS